MGKNGITLVLRVCNFLAIALLASCGHGPPRVKVEPTVVTPAQIANLVKATEQEWVLWGKRVVRVEPALPTCLWQPDGSCLPVDTGCGDEKTSRLCEVVVSYWNTIGIHGDRRHPCKVVDVCPVTWPTGNVLEKSDAWSAAFVSAMMIRAGFSSKEFWPAGNHAAYIVASRHGYSSAFETVATPARPQVGDVICVPRNKTRLTPADIHTIKDGGYEMHCDIVVEIDTTNKLLHAIGGNVQETVARIVVPLDEQGFLRFQEFSPRPWILVLRARRAPVPQAVDAASAG